MNLAEIKFLRRELESIKIHYSVTKNKKYEEEKEQFMIIRAMHTIEKGLSLSSPRPGFGAKKVLALIDRINSYKQAGYNCSHESIQMAIGAIKSYIDWNKERNALQDGIEEKYLNLIKDIDCSGRPGGASYYITKDILPTDLEAFQNLVDTRHSIRNFGDKDITLEELKDAIQDANKCPSACNRQSTKVYIINSEDGKKYMASHLEGTGGFADECAGFILVTGNISAFDFLENNQWIVSGGIFVGFLVLALHARGIATCVVQRPFVRSKQMQDMRKHFSIPDNQEIICAIGYGAYPDSFMAPNSVRLNNEKIVEIR